MKGLLKTIALYPFSVIYGFAILIRNWLFDTEIVRSTCFDFPVISVGNITVGGTGKTPHVEFLIELLMDNFKVAVLSRGYKRKTKGFVLATENASSLTIGDEPFQIFRKYKNTTVAVDEKRVDGIQQLKLLQPDIDIVLLDDAFQHRAVNPGLKILLTDYSRLYIHDSLLPGGLLREHKSGSKRADIVVVTKCPTDLGNAEMAELTHKLKIWPHQSLYFSTFIYDTIKPVFQVEKSQPEIADLKGVATLLVTGIVSHQPIVRYLQTQGAFVESVSYPDHHHFTPNNFIDIEQKYIHLHSDKKIILVTEKDAARIVSSSAFPDSLKSLMYYLPIRIHFLQNKKTQFTQNVLQYVETYTRNS